MKVDRQSVVILATNNLELFYKIYSHLCKVFYIIIIFLEYKLSKLWTMNDMWTMIESTQVNIEGGKKFLSAPPLR